MLDQALLNRIQDPEVRDVVKLLANLYEQAMTENDNLKAKIQLLEDEINRLKGEHGNPDIKRNRPKPPDSGDQSSETERKERKPWTKRSKNKNLIIDRTVRLPAPSDMPPDAAFKDYERVTVQNLIVKTETICFERAKYYSATTGKTYLSPLPPGYTRDFGPNVKAVALTLHHVGNVSQNALEALFHSIGLQISAGAISNLLVKDQDDFHKEKRDIGLAGLASSSWQQTDDTYTSVNGVNHHAHVLCNPLYTRYETLAHKDRLSVLDVLLNGKPREFVLTPEVLGSEAVGKLPRKWHRVLADLPQGKTWNEADLTEMLDEKLKTLSKQGRKSLLEQMALAAYRSQDEVPVIDLLLCDDAPQFPGLTVALALCWVHDARHYKKLTPHLDCHRQTLSEFMERYWAYYYRLSAYRDAPTDSEREALWRDFDKLFVPNTDYGDLNSCIQRTANNKEKLLQVLWHPEIPLHNNASELAARLRVRKRDVSFGPRTSGGANAWDTFQTIAATAQKLGVNFTKYLTDRITKTFEMPSLASLITARTPIKLEPQPTRSLPSPDY